MPTRAHHDWIEPLRRQARGRQPLWVAFSGGLDSTVLLHVLAQDSSVMAGGLHAIHIDHGLQADATAWARHCQRVCDDWRVPLTVRRVHVHDHGRGPEASAREARYAAFAEGLPAGTTLALAQHRDDQAETVLLRLLRGSASAGLAGMQATRACAGITLWRPLLALTRAELLDYAQQHGLHWQDDPSNTDTRLDRNFLRQQVLPLIRQRWPDADGALAASARWLGEDAELLAAEAAQRLAQVRGEDPATLMLGPFDALLPAWRSRVLRRWVRELGLPPLPQSAIAQLLGPMRSARADAVPSLHWDGAVIHRWRHRFWAERSLPAITDHWQRPWHGRSPLTLPDGRRFELAGAHAALDAQGYRVSTRRGGERLRLPGRDHHCELKTLLQTLGIPPWRRARLPLLFAADGELLAAGEAVTSARLQALGLQWRETLSADGN